MMNRQRKAFQLISLFLLVMLVFTGCGDKKQTPAAEENMDQTAQTALTAGVDYLRSQLELSTYSSDNDDLVYLLARAGLLTEADAAAYEEGLTAAIKSSWDLEKVTQWQKIAFAVAAAGGDPSDQAGMDFLSMVLSYDVTDENNEVDLYVLNSKLLAAGAFGDPMQDARIAADMVLAKQNADGAFEDQWGTTLDSTSMTLQALAASRSGGGRGCERGCGKGCGLSEQPARDRRELFVQRYAQHNQYRTGLHGPGCLGDRSGQRSAFHQGGPQRLGSLGDNVSAGIRSQRGRGRLLRADAGRYGACGWLAAA